MVVPGFRSDCVQKWRLLSLDSHEPSTSGARVVVLVATMTSTTSHHATSRRPTSDEATCPLSMPLSSRVAAFLTSITGWQRKSS